MDLVNTPDFANKNGWIEVITGCMFSGKTEMLIHRVELAMSANYKVGVFKPAIDIRYGSNELISHNSQTFPSTSVRSSQEILTLANGATVIGIDESQFFDVGLTEVCQKLANMGKYIIVAGLDMDYTGHAFGPMPELMAISEYITKLHAICEECGELAQFSFRKSSNKSQILLGEKEMYAPLCRECFHKNQLNQ